MLGDNSTTQRKYSTTDSIYSTAQRDNSTTHLNIIYKTWNLASLQTGW